MSVAPVGVLITRLGWRPLAAHSRVQQLCKSPPGQEYEYSNTNTILLGLVVEKVPGHLT